MLDASALVLEYALTKVMQILTSELASQQYSRTRRGNPSSYLNLETFYFLSRTTKWQPIQGETQKQATALRGCLSMDISKLSEGKKEEKNKVLTRVTRLKTNCDIYLILRWPYRDTYKLWYTVVAHLFRIA